MAAVSFAPVSGVADEIRQPLGRVVSGKGTGRSRSGGELRRRGQKFRQALGKKLRRDLALRDHPAAACRGKSLRIAALVVVGGKGIGDQQRRPTGRRQFRYGR